MRSFGREYFQNNSPIQSAKFVLYMPNKLTFKAKSYNQLNQPVRKEYKKTKTLNI